MKSNRAELSFTIEKEDELNGDGCNHDSIQHFECPYCKDKLPKKDLSFNKLSPKSDIPDDRSILSGCGLRSYFDRASTSGEINSTYSGIKDIDSDFLMNRHSKEIKPKQAERKKIVDIFGEYDEIDGFMFHSFTKMDHLEKFEDRTARNQAKNPEIFPSAHLANGKLYFQKVFSSSPHFSREDPGRTGASFLIHLEEPYCENYDVPYAKKPNKRQVVDECSKPFCRLGCICESLNSTRPPLAHCNHTECMCYIVCIYKSSLRRCIPTSSTENDTSREFFGFDLPAEQVPPERWPLLKHQLDLQKEIIHHLQLQLDSKQLEINSLKNQFVTKSTAKNTTSLQQRASTKNTTLSSVKKLKTKMEVKVKTKVGTTMKTKGEAKVDRRVHVDGHYVDSFPFDEDAIDRLSTSTTVTRFIRQLMRNMFTVDFLSSKSSKWMTGEHRAAIIDATMKRFQVHWRRNGDSMPVTPEMVQQVIVSEFNLKQTRKRTKTNKLK